MININGGITNDLTEYQINELKKYIKEELVMYTAKVHKQQVIKSANKKWSNKKVGKNGIEKRNGSFYNDFVILDSPVDFMSTFQINNTQYNSLDLSTSHLRYEFEVKVSWTDKPKIISATKIDDGFKDGDWFSINLDGQALNNFPENKTKVVLEVSKPIRAYTKMTLKRIKDEIVEVAMNNDASEIVIGFDNYQDALTAMMDLTINYKYDFFGISFAEKTTDEMVKKEFKIEGEIIDGFYLQEDLVPLLNPVSKAIESGDRFCFMLTGEAGYGKTSAFKAIAAKVTEKTGLDFPILYIDCATMLNTTDWFGTMQAKDGNTFFETNDFTHYLRKGNCLIILDEFNRLSIDVANSLLPILDDRGETTVRNTHIKVGDGVMFGITINQGSEYTGIGGVIDKAIKSRIIGELELKPLPPHIEGIIIKEFKPDLADDILEKIINIMHNLRETLQTQRDSGNYITIDVSTRATRKIAWWLNLGLDFKLALDYTIFNGLDESEKIPFIDNLKINGVF